MSEDLIRSVFTHSQTLRSIDSMAFPGSSQDSLSADVMKTLPLTPSESGLLGLQSPRPAATSPLSLVFVDSGVRDASTLLAHSSPGTQIFYLNTVEDAVTQITHTLLGYKNVSSLHILSHGESGALDFANGSLSANNLGQYTAQIKSWSQALSAGADILLYGCDVAEGTAGAAFIQELGQLSQADIAASTNLTGAGGDWILEASTGKIESSLISDETGRSQYQYSLDSAVQLLSNSNATLSSDAVGGDLGDRSVSADGNFIVFSSAASNLVTGDTNGKRDIFLFDRTANTITLVSHALAGLTQPSNGESSNASISANGNFVVFTSTGSNLTSETKAGTNVDVFRWNRSNGAIELISKAGTVSGAGDSTTAVISADGGTIGFLSGATNLTGATITDLNNSVDAFVWTQSGLKVISLDQSGTTTADRGVGSNIDISADGRFIVFNTQSALNTNDTNGNANDIYVYDRSAESVDLVSLNALGNAGGATANIVPRVSFVGNKLRVLFTSFGRLTAEDRSSLEDVYVAEKDFTDPANPFVLRLVSRVTNALDTTNNGKNGNNTASNAVFSGNGRYVAFTSNSSNLVAGDTNASQDVFIHDLDATDPDTATKIVSRNSAAGALGNGNSGSRISVSDDGSIVAFTSAATNLVDGDIANDTNAGEDLFAYNTTTNTLTLVTRKTGTNTTATLPALGAFQQRSIRIVTNGASNSIVYTSDASDLVEKDTNDVNDIFSFNLTTPANTLITKIQGNQASVTGIGNANLTSVGSVSRDGRYVVFTSDANSLVAGDRNSAKDVFLRDTTLPATDANALKLVSRTATGSGNQISSQPFISADGQYIVFSSAATDLAAGDTNGQQDIFLYTVSTGAIVPVSKSTTAFGDNASSNASVAVDANGEVYVAFVSRASNLAATGTGVNNIFVWKKSTGAIALVSKASATAGGNQDSSAPIISADGKYIAFTSNASNLTTANFTGTDGNNASDVFLYNIATATLNLASQNANVVGNGSSYNPIISDTNGVVAFESRASNLTTIADTNNNVDIFRYSTATGTSLVSVNTAGTAAGTVAGGGFGATGASISADGNTIAFTSDSSDLSATTDTNGKTDVFVRNITTATTTLISRSKTTPTSAANGDSNNAVLSADGQLVAFTSTATDLSSQDTSSSRDVFTSSTLTPSAKLVSSVTTGANTVSSNGDAASVSLSRDGGLVVFESNASNLVANDLNSSSDIFSRPTRPSVSFKVVDAAASEGTIDTGSYEITRTDSTGSLQVKLKLSDLAPLTDAIAADFTLSADQGATVTILAGIVTVTIPDTIAKVTLTLTAIADNLTEGSENATFTLQPDATYTIDPALKTGTVVIAPSGTSVSNTNDSGAGSLRQAIANARLTPGADIITFALTNPALKTITLLTALDALNGDITIDGGTSGVILSGLSAAAGTNGLAIAGNNNVVKGITVTGFTGNGILVEGNNNTIGGTVAGNGNSVNANKLGVYVKSGTGNQILGNNITNNTDLGIDISPIGIDPDPLLLTTANANATGATVNGTLTGVAGTYRVEFFSNTTTDTVGRTEGETYLGFQDVTITGTSAPVVFTSTVAGLVGKYISATVTNNTTKATSEFVKDIRVTTPLPTVDLVSAEAITGVNEGDTGTTDYKFNIKLSKPVTADTTFTYSTLSGTGATGAIADTDFIGVTNGTVTVLSGTDTATITVKIKGDTRFEADKTFSVQLSGIDSAIYASGTLLATGIIKNDDKRPTISFESPTFSIVEGQNTPNGQLPFKINLSNASDEAITVTYETVDGTGPTGAISTGTAKDFTGQAPTPLTFAPGETSKTVNVEIIADNISEPTETFGLRLSKPTNATLAGTATTLDATGIVITDESPYKFSVTANNPTVLEGNVGTKTVQFTVTLDRTPQEDLTVDYSTLDGTALQGTDFVNNGGTLTFAKNGPLTQTIDVVINSNTIVDGDRSFSLQIYPPASGRAVIDSTKASATTLIQDDDLPTISFKVGNTGEIRRVEGPAGTTTTAEVVVELSQIITKDVTVEFTTVDGTATVADNDYIPRTTPGQKITIRAGNKSATASFTIVGDDKVEPDETFFVKLSNPIGATLLGSDTQAIIIENDDGLVTAQPKVSIAALNATQNEGAAGTTTTFTFSVTLDKAPEAGKPVSVNVSTVDGTGTTGATTADSDYVAKTQLFTFNPGDALTQIFSVQVNGDNKIESNETFTVVLGAPTNATLLTSSAIGTILNDDGPVSVKPVITITPATLAQPEGNTGTTPYTFTIQLDRPPAAGETVTVDVATVDGIGANGAISTGSSADFTAKTQSFTFTSTGALTQNFTVLVNGDTQIEPDETFTVELRNPSGATLSSNKIATATILNDDTPIVTLPRISVGPVTQAEGNSGTTPFTFRIQLDKAPDAGQTVSVEVATIDGVGSSGAISTGSNADFTAKTQTFTFTSTGALTQDFTVLVNGDTQVEPDETFTIALRNVVGAVLSTNQAVGTILNDDSLNSGGSNNISVDSLNDILWRNPTTGETLLWQTNLGPTTRADIIPNNYDPSVWRYGGTADFNKDGSPDVLWHNIQTGEVIIWKTNGNAIQAFINPTLPSLGSNFKVDGSWHIEDISDYTGDNKPDILWRNYQTNQVVVWEMNGFDYVSSKYISQPISLDWKVEAIADFTGIGSKSLFWRNQRTGDTVLWKIAGEQWINNNWTGGLGLNFKVDSSWKVVGTGDINGDRTSDVLWQNTVSGEAVVWYMGRSGLIRGELLPKPTNGFTIAGAADFNLDGVTDLLLQNPLTRQNQIWYLQQGPTGIVYGSSSALPNAAPGSQFLGISRASGSTVPQLIWRNIANRDFITWQISSSPTTTSTPYSTLSDPDLQILWTGDLNNSSKAKVITRNQRNGIIEIGDLSNGVYTKVSNLLPLDRNWVYRGTGDVDADGIKDIFWQNLETGKVEIWKVGGPSYAKVLTPEVIPGPDWVINQVADFDGDGQADIFWRNTRTQQTVIWLMNGQNIKDSGLLANVSFDWQVMKVADFDRNGTADLLWRNSRTGEVVTWLMDGKTIKKGNALPTVNDAAWVIKAVADFDRDGNNDILWYNSQTKQTVFWKMRDGQYQSSVLLPNVPSSSWDLVGTRDFNADGSLDLLWLDKATGTPTIWYLNGMTYGTKVTLPDLPNPNFQVIGLDDFNQIPA